MTTYFRGYKISRIGKNLEYFLHKICADEQVVSSRTIDNLIILMITIFKVLQKLCEILKILYPQK